MAPFGSARSRLNTPGRTHKLFTRDPHNFKYYRKANIRVTAEGCGPSGELGNMNSLASSASPMPLFPALSWQWERPGTVEDDEYGYEEEELTKEYLLLVEDLDGTTVTWVNTARLTLLGAYYGIPASASSIRGEEMIKVKKAVKWLMSAQRGLIGGFKYGDVGGEVWNKPKSLHRIHFQIVALSKSVDTLELSEHPTKESFNGAVEGKVLGWGEWVGIYDPEKA